MTIDATDGPPRWPGSREAEQAEALALAARVLREHASPTIDTRDVRTQVAAVLSAVATELHNGRVVPLGVRGASLRLVRELRFALDPNAIAEP